jgi:hypothetical protein
MATVAHSVVVADGADAGGTGGGTDGVAEDEAGVAGPADDDAVADDAVADDALADDADRAGGEPPASPLPPPPAPGQVGASGAEDAPPFGRDGAPPDGAPSARAMNLTRRPRMSMIAWRKYSLTLCPPGVCGWRKLCTSLSLGKDSVSTSSFSERT